jgi:quercetin dioxygenase-like cupin family protein
MERKEFLLAALMTGVASSSFGSVLPSVDPRIDPFYIPPDTEPLVPIHGIDIRMKVRSKQTNNQFSCVDVAVAPRTMGPNPHVHKDLEELIYVHKGTMHVMVEEKVFEVKAGGWHLRPRGMVHTFFNATDEPVFSTDMYFNQNFDDFLEEIFFKILPEMRRQNLTIPTPEMIKRFRELDEIFGMKQFPEMRAAIVSKYGLKN